MVSMDEDPEDKGVITLGGSDVVLSLDRKTERNITSAVRRC